MKKIIFSVIAVVWGLTVAAETKLYVKLMNEDEQTEFELAKTKITFDAAEETMTVAGEIYDLSNVQNLSFTKTASSIVPTLVAENISVYPNPVKDELNVVIDNFTSDLSYVIYDLNGKSLKADRLSSSATQISMANVHTGTYVLQVERGGKRVQSFKIVKQ